ncbi:uncharacterized protein LOC130962430 [Arachis stenosperma]|uniref:uncharacterized protein LOC130962430 n=1 Tax=Arachis stenosperma TaxID=217475 RepID=UPI0025AD9C26|nr:uncharacterized protein LOC130962430 [Arachis stenosperma]
MRKAKQKRTQQLDMLRRTLLRKKSSFLRNTHISLLESVHPEGWNPMWSFASMLGDSFIHVVLPHQIRARHSVFLHFILYGQQPNHRQYKHHHHWEAAFSKIFPFFQLQGNIQENVPKYVKKYNQEQQLSQQVSPEQASEAEPGDTSSKALLEKGSNSKEEGTKE